MKGFIAKRLWTKAVLLLSGGAALAGSGCFGYGEIVDPCYPDRYEYMSRKETQGALGAQVQKGHMLEQTVWMYHFKLGEPVLTEMGLDHLAHLARRLPTPDPLLYLQTAQDISYDPAAPDKMCEARKDLDSKRIAAIQKFMQAQCKGYEFQVAVIDPADVGLPGIAISSSINQLNTRFRGGLTGSGASSTGGGGTGK